ncbi:MAG: serine kinase [Deltaproteobacteria bacterium]|nr:serine kinase [Deltaproteobacteria bacterium]
MKLSTLKAELGLEHLTPALGDGLDAEVARGHVSDLLSDVLGRAPAEAVLVTIQVHMNVVAVCVHAGLEAVVFAAGRRPDDAVCAKAAEEGLQLFASKQSAFELVGRMYELGLR